MELDKRDLLIDSSINDAIKEPNEHTKCCKSMQECDCIFNRFSYIRVIISGIIATCAISGIYTYLSHITTVEVARNITPSSIDPVQIIRGISCWPITISNVSCNTMAVQMANMASNGSIDYQCNLHTQYNSNDSLYSDIILFKLSIIFLIFFSITYGLSAIVHDSTLIYYRNNLKMLTFHPINKIDFYLHTKYILFWKSKITPLFHGGSKYLIYCCFPISILFFSLLLLLRFICFGLDVVWMLGIYPFISSCWKIDRNKINAFSYVSSSWVGVSRFMMLNTTTLMVYFATSAHIEKPLDAKDASVCRCSCRYVFTPSDFYSFLAVTYIFVLLNAKFVFSWFMESVHGQHYLYLIEYSLPIEIANSINNKDCAGDMMMKKDNLYRTDSEKQKQSDLNGHNKQKHIDNSAENNDWELEGDISQKQNRVEFIWRLILMFFVIYSFLFIGGSMIFIAFFNEYQYSMLLRVILYIIGAVICIGVIIIFFMMRAYYKRKTN
eukprot:515586_1